MACSMFNSSLNMGMTKETLDRRIGAQCNCRYDPSSAASRHLLPASGEKGTRDRESLAPRRRALEIESPSYREEGHSRSRVPRPAKRALEIKSRSSREEGHSRSRVLAPEEEHSACSRREPRAPRQRGEGARRQGE